MKTYITFILLTFVLSTSFATNRESSTANNAETEFEASSQNDVKKWRIHADTWIINENRWYDYPQLIHILWSSSRGYYMWSIGGSTSPVIASNKRGYDYMVDSPNGKWRFYFRRGDLR